MPRLSGDGGRVVSPEEILGARRIIVPANGLEFEVFEAGTGDRLALLLHGFPQHAVIWRHLIAPLAAAGFRVWAVNQRGYGGSSRPAAKEDYTLEALTGDVAALIDASGAARVSLVGHDWGGFVAWIFAIRRLRPLDRLVVINIPHPLSFRRALKRWGQRFKSFYIGLFQIPRLADWLLSAGGGALTAFLFRRAAKRAGAIPEEVVAIYRENAASPGGATAMLNWYRAAGREIVQATDLGAIIDTPTLIVWGLDDLALGEDCLVGTERYVTHLRVERLPGVSHFSPEDAPDAVNAAIVGFLSEPGGLA